MTDTAPITANRTLPRRQPNAAYRQREYLTEKEVERLIEAARKRGRNGARDSAAILLAYRHGLRASELCSFVGRRLIPGKGAYTSIAQKAALRASIHYMGQN